MVTEFWAGSPVSCPPASAAVAEVREASEQLVSVFGTHHAQSPATGWWLPPS
tara:strand:+ start:579 stop:734 length:156 start_codon:yes stop_codon:yes gene_type:complete